MSKLTVGTIDTPDNTTPLLMETGSGAAGGQIKLESANDNIVFDGTTVFTGQIPRDTWVSNQANAAHEAANTLPQNRQTTAYILTSTDAGKYIHLSGGNISIPAATFSNGDVVIVFNSQQIARTIGNSTSVTIVQPAANTTGNVTIEGYGLASIMCVDSKSNTFTVSGAGVA